MCIKLIKGFPDQAKRIMIIGHNPTFEDLVEHLSGEYHDFPTAAIAHFQLPIESWGDMKNSTHGKLMKVWRPKELSDK